MVFHTNSGKFWNFRTVAKSLPHESQGSNFLLGKKRKFEPRNEQDKMLRQFENFWNPQRFLWKTSSQRVDGKSFFPYKYSQFSVAVAIATFENIRRKINSLRNFYMHTSCTLSELFFMSTESWSRGQLVQKAYYNTYIFKKLYMNIILV